MENRLELRNISKLFGEVQALENIDFQLGQNEVVGLLGHNGAGKSTVIKIITGYHQPTSGEIFFNGQKVNNLTVPMALQLGVETVYQERALAAWVFAELIEPGWIASFLDSVRVYNAMNHPEGVLAFLGPGGTVLSLILLSLAVVVFVWNRFYLANSILFAGSLVLSLSIWWMIVPIIGMMNLVVLPLALIWLLSNLEKTRPALNRFALVFYIVLYLLGFAGFIYGLTRPELYGLHIQLSDLAYNVVAPIMTTILTIPLCFASRPLPNLNLFGRKEAL